MKHMMCTDNLFHYLEEHEVKLYLAQLIIGAPIVCLSPINRINDNKFENFSFNYLPIPENKTRSPEFPDVMNTIAKRLWDENEIITILWSGGIDSTAAATALILNCDQWKERLRFLYTDTSILEYEEFYANFVSKAKDHREVSEKDLFEKEVPSALLDSLVTSGECGDQIFGSMILAKDPEVMTKPYKSIMNWNNLITENSDVINLGGPQHQFIFERAGKNLQDYTINYMESIIEACPFKIVTIFDLFWWLNYSLKWNLCVYRALRKCRLPQPFDINNWYPFYNAPELHQWSIDYHDTKVAVGGQWKTYKQPAKDYIFEMAGDEDYKTEKIKTASLTRETREHEGHVSLIDADGYCSPFIHSAYLEVQITPDAQFNPYRHSFEKIPSFTTRHK